jgi:hypothetical protein
MDIRETAQKGRRPRRQNGNARPDALWPVRGIEDTTKNRINYLANELGTTNGAVIDLATKLLFQTLHDQDKEHGRKRNTFSDTLSLFASLLGDASGPSNDPTVIELEKRLQRQKEARDVLMGRKSANASPAASQKGQEI